MGGHVGFGVDDAHEGEVHGFFAVLDVDVSDFPVESWPHFADVAFDEESAPESRALVEGWGEGDGVFEFVLPGPFGVYSVLDVLLELGVFLLLYLPADLLQYSH